MRWRWCRRVTGGVLVALTAFGAWDRPPLDAGSRASEVAGASISLGGFDHLGDRLRLPEPGSEVAAPVVAAPVVPAGDVAIAPPPEKFDGPAAPATPPPPQLRPSRREVTPSGGTWAVMIGVNDYPGSGHDLRSAVNDANDVNDAVARFGVQPERRLLLRDGQASGRSIRAAAEWLTDHAGPDATAVFFFAGHIRKLGSGREAMVGADGVTVTDAELAGIFGDLQARRVWIGLAACYAGGFDEVLAPGRILTAAAPADSLAYENESFGRSYLVEYMVRRAMIADALTTVEAAFASAQAGLRQDYPNRVPVQYDSFAGELDLRAPGAAPPPKAPAQADAGAGSGGSGSGGSGGSGSGSSPPPPTTTTTAPKRDGCASITVGIVQCKED